MKKTLFSAANLPGNKDHFAPLSIECFRVGFRRSGSKRLANTGTGHQQLINRYERRLVGDFNFAGTVCGGFF